MKAYPHLDYELDLWKKGFLVAGIDEVGRGAFAGPLVVGAVILKPIQQFNNSAIKQLYSIGINDSKLLTSDRRKLILKLAQEFILYSQLQYISCDKINEKGVGFANKLGFELVAKKISLKGRTFGKNAKSDTPKRSDLKERKIFFLSDAFKIPKVSLDVQKNIVRGDTLSISIALASILAKVTRDSYMEKLSVKFPSYGFERNKGYGTLFHRESIKTQGPNIHHRTAFIHSKLEI